ncbi:MAG: sigma-54 dependent transcriptional regulator [Desulfuromonadia bacterium]
MDHPLRILLVDDDHGSRLALSRLLSRAGYDVRAAGNGDEALKCLEGESFPLIITDLLLPDMSGIDILKRVKDREDGGEVIVITGNASARSAVEAMKEGAYDYITKPLDFDELTIVVSKALEKRRLHAENIYLRKQLRDRYEFSNIIGSSPAMQQVFNLMRRIVKTDSTVLIMGESGTGKEIVAKAIHFNSHRKDKPFVAVHCGAIPETLLESELFGHTRGAFTGAHREKIGKFQAADGGSIFLDEIGTMPLQLQSKLLRVIQEQEVEMIGATRSTKIDVRIISATNQNLAEEVKRGLFREDLYYRLNVIPLTIPPLRERTSDILPLFRHFLSKYGAAMGRGEMSVSREVVEALEQYRWPGNVRELENVVERMVALAEGSHLSLADLPPGMQGEKSGPTGWVGIGEGGIDLPRVMEEMEWRLIQEALERAAGVKSRAAELLGINRTTLVQKLRRKRPLDS